MTATLQHAPPAPRRAPETYGEMIAAGWTLWGVPELAGYIGKRPLAVHQALDALDARAGGGLPDDIPAPVIWYAKHPISGRKPHRPEPYWVADDARQWAQQTGKVARTWCPTDVDPVTYDEMIAAGWTLWGYEELALVTARKPQSMRKLLVLRNEHIREDAASQGVPLEQGEALPDDIPEPVVYRPSRRWPEPYWREDDARRWAMQTGKLAADGMTPLPPRPGGSLAP